MATHNSNDVYQEEERAEVAEVEKSTWQATWENNKGMLFILMSEVAGSSMDAIVRFVQQGDHSMHPLQVSISPPLTPSSAKFILSRSS